MAENSETDCTGDAQLLKKSEQISKRSFGVLELLVAMALVAAAFVFFDFPKAQSDELLARLTAMSRKGSAALCDPAHIENHLLVRIEEKSEKEFSSPVNSSDDRLSGHYSRFPAGQETVCKLRLRMAGHRFCDSDSARTQRLIGRRLQRQMAVPGESGFFYDHAYELAQDATQRMVLGWRETGRMCPVDVEVVGTMR